GACLSAIVEFLQLFTAGRSTSFVDVVTNSFGATVGALAGWPWIGLVWPVASIRLRQLLIARPLLACGLLTCAILLRPGLSPFQFHPRPRDLRHSLETAQLVPFNIAAESRLRAGKPLNWTAEFLTWTLVGGLVALAAREARQTPARTRILAAAVAFGLSFTVE